MRVVSMEPVERLRRALFPVEGDQLGWRVGSVAVSIVSAVLITLTLTYKLRGAELPSALLLALLVAFATVVLLLSKFLSVAYHEQHQTRGALNTSEREFQSIFENALDAILILDNQAICREANPAAEHSAARELLLGIQLLAYIPFADLSLRAVDGPLARYLAGADAATVMP